MSERIHPRYIAEDSSSNEKKIAKSKELARLLTPEILGKAQVAVIRDRRKNNARLKQELDEFGPDDSIEEIVAKDTQYIYQTLEKVADRLFDFANKSENLSGFFYFFTEMLDERAPIRDRVKAIIQKDQSPSKDTVKLARAFLRREIDVDLFEEMVHWHVEKTTQEFSSLEKELGDYKKRFKERVLVAIDDGRLPIDKTVLEKRLAHFENILIADPVLKGDADGSHNAAQTRVTLTAGVPDAEHVYTHEMTHGLSGRTIFQYNRLDGDSRDHQHQRVGLRFSNTVVTPEGKILDDNDRKISLVWLNEAVTEEIAIELMGVVDSDSYGQERKLLKDLYAKGLSKQLLYAAYFENRDTTATMGNQLPAWRALVEHCNQTFKDQGGIRYLYTLQSNKLRE